MENQTQYSDVVRFIMEHRSGETAELMQKWGLSYNMTYGVSLSQILEFVRDKQKNTDLAKQLWKENMRETKLISFHFFDPLQISPEYADTLVDEFANHELVEQGTLYLMVNLPYAPEKVAQWVVSEKPYVKMTAYMLLGRIALKRKDVSLEYFGTFFENMKNDATNANLFVRKSITIALTAIARTSVENKNKVQAFVNSLDEIDSDYAKFISKTTSDELQYI